TLPSASFSQLLTKLALPQLMDRSISAHKGLEPFALTSCPAHIACNLILSLLSSTMVSPSTTLISSLTYGLLCRSQPYI
ncbi:hypothetical protein, partial [Candidatus Bandiella numerosa]|uniref:hypothetical protein n=1 Tax=Candidatus Bandiella numerosa TaxID=2570586 RepID=UPI001F187758